MSATPNRNTGLYRELVLGLVRDFLHLSSVEAERILSHSGELPYGGFFEGLPYESLKIEFTLGWDGLITVEATAEDVGIVQWAPTEASTSEVVRPIMNIGGLHKALYDFHLGFVKRCTRQLLGRARLPLTPYMTNSAHFAELGVRAYLENPKLVVQLADDELRINQRVFRTGRAWRKDVRAAVGL